MPSDPSSSFVDSQESRNPSTVSVPSIQDPANLVDQEPTLVKPPPEEYINRDLRPGHKRYIAQQAERAIYTADHELHHIDVKLQKNRDHLYTVARGAKNELVAAEDGSFATAQMANAVRAQQEMDMATVEKHIQNIKSQMIDVQGEDNKAHAKLQLELERQKRKHTELLAQAKTMGEAVDQAITKAGEIEGRARANYHANMDPNMELEHAIIEAAKAKMALAQHDKEVALENKQEKTDEKKEDFFNKVEEKGQEAMQKIKDTFEEQKAAQEEADHKAEVESAKAVEKEAATVGTIPAPKIADPVVKGEKPLPPPVTQEAATATAQNAVAQAHASGDPADVAKAVNAIQTQKNAKPTPAPAPESVEDTVAKSAEIAKEATEEAAAEPAADDKAADETETSDGDDSPA